MALRWVELHNEPESMLPAITEVPLGRALLTLLDGVGASQNDGVVECAGRYGFGVLLPEPRCMQTLLKIQALSLHVDA